MEPSWQKLKMVKVESTVALWSLAKEYIAGSRLLRFTVVDRDEQKQTASISWSPIKGTTCGANGIVAIPPKSGCLSTGALYGALIGKLGGSSADIPDSHSSIRNQTCICHRHSLRYFAWQFRRRATISHDER
jgi:hypothetical protein